MIGSESNFWGGLLLHWAGGDVRTLDLRLSRHLEFVGNIDSSPWEKFLFRSPRPLLRSDETGLETFSYNVIVRRGRERILILSEAKPIVEEILTDINSHLDERLNRVYIYVDKLVRDIVADPETYFLTVAHARLPAGGALLRSASFYGDNLGGARWFRSQIDIMKFFGCGLRKADGGPELIRVSSDGSIYCHAADPKKLAMVQAVLTFLDKGSYLDRGGA